MRDFSDLEILLDPYGKNPHDVLLTIKGSSAQKNSFPLLWAVVEKLPRAGGSFRIPLTAAKKS